jgi:hypothetical protein
MSFGYYVVIVVWVCFTLHFVIAFAAGDFCSAANDYVVSQNIASTNQSGLFFNSATKGVFDLIVQCQNNQSLIPALDFSRSTVKQIVKQFNDEVDKVDTSQKHNYTETNLSDALEIPAVKNNATVHAALSNMIDITNKYLVMLNNLTRLLNCDYIANGFLSVRDSACVDALSATDLLWVVFLLLGFAEFFIVNIAFFVFKRFRRLKFVTPKISSQAISVEFLTENRN